MKKKVSYFFIVMFYFLFSIGCSDKTENNVDYDNYTLSYKSERGLLVFSSTQHMLDAYNRISELLETDQYTDSSLSLLLEKRNDYKNMMHKYLREEKEWLSNDSLILENDPDEKYIDDDALRLLLNAQGEFIIGDTIFKFIRDEAICKIIRIGTY